jgi:hypothetical protein
MKLRRWSALALWAILRIGSLPAQSIDGVIEPGEYAHERTLAGGRFQLAWSFGGERIFLGMSMATRGWVAVGFDPIVVLDNADLIIGWVDMGEDTPAGQVRAIDAHSLGPNGPIVADTALGGTDDILERAGTERNGRTTIELSRLLDTADPHDHPIDPGGGTRVVWAYGATDDFRDRAVEYGGITWLRPAEAAPAGGPRPLTLSIVFLTLAFFPMAAAVLSAAYRRGRGRRRAHRVLVAAAAALAAGGLAAAVYLSAAAPRARLGALHTVLSALAFAAAAATLLADLRLPAAADKVPAWHGWPGRAALLLLAAALLVGLLRAGVF